MWAQPLIVWDFFPLKRWSLPRLCGIHMKWVGRGRIAKTYLGVSGHFDASVQELIKVLAELAGGGGQLAAGSARGVDDLACRVVEFSRGVVQISLRLLECFMARWELRGDGTDGRTRTQTRKLMHFSMPWPPPPNSISLWLGTPVSNQQRKYVKKHQLL